MTVRDLFEILKSPEFSCFFSVFTDKNYETRYKIRSFSSIDELIKDIEWKLLNRVEGSINSDDFNIIEASFLDCYYTLHNE